MKRIIPALMAALMLAGCGWTGTGTVLDKGHRSAWVQMIPTGQNGSMTTIYHPECWELTVKDIEGDTHSGCVKQSIWETAVVGSSITLTKETAG